MDTGESGVTGVASRRTGGVTGDGGAGEDGLRACTCAGSGPAFRLGGMDARFWVSPRRLAPGTGEFPRTAPIRSISASSTIIRCK